MAELKVENNMEENEYKLRWIGFNQYSSVQALGGRWNMNMSIFKNLFCPNKQNKQANKQTNNIQDACSWAKVKHTPETFTALEGSDTAESPKALLAKAVNTYFPPYRPEGMTMTCSPS